MHGEEIELSPTGLLRRILAPCDVGENNLRKGGPQIGAKADFAIFVATESLVPDDHADLARSATDEAANEKSRCLPRHPVVDSDKDVARSGIEIRNQGDDPFAALAGSNQLFA